MRIGRLGKIGIGWGFITVAGIAGFVYSKHLVDKNRYENMKIRKRMRESNLGEYTVESPRRY
ncbi:uncharacterized protein LOC129770719 [Toxorhynchites rutilus septentrionalis]|uniref:uncharacterized protein LOC129770719 n=1 Tax=Toxorhynchites rutilus septentrionalis TaxID=329112 RepID=UPI0024785178|nr:uncharacterized protein LOC129770719 [Toxorhynchites rutilus septentrionalis]